MVADETGIQETRDRILAQAEDLLRRYGPAKTTVTDVAKALGMSHTNVYRYFPSKAALQDAVAERWLERVSAPLAEIAAGDGPASQRLEAWLLALAEAKRRKVVDDPELFATYHAVAMAARDVVEAHIGTMREQVALILRSGIDRGEFRTLDPDATAGAILDATARFHHPHHVLDNAGRPVEPLLRPVVELLLAGLADRVPTRAA